MSTSHPLSLEQGIQAARAGDEVVLQAWLDAMDILRPFEKNTWRQEAMREAIDAQHVSCVLALLKTAGRQEVPGWMFNRAIDSPTPEMLSALIPHATRHELDDALLTAQRRNRYDQAAVVLPHVSSKALVPALHAAVAANAEPFVDELLRYSIPEEGYNWALSCAMDAGLGHHAHKFLDKCNLPQVCSHLIKHRAWDKLDRLAALVELPRRMGNKALQSAPPDQMPCLRAQHEKRVLLRHGPPLTSESSTPSSRMRV